MGGLWLGGLPVTLWCAESARVPEGPPAPAPEKDGAGALRDLPEGKRPPEWTPWLAKGAQWLQRRQQQGDSEKKAETEGRVRVSGSQLLAAWRFVAEVDEPLVPPAWMPGVAVELNKTSIRDAEAHIQRVQVGWEEAGVQLSHQWAETDVEERITAIEVQWKW